MIVFASILGAILATGLLALNPSTITSAVAELYADQYGYNSNYYQDDNRYSYDNNHQKKNSHTDIQKIKCANSNINVNGIDITQISQDSDGVAAANEGVGGADSANTENGNGLADRINVERNLVNICVNVNQNSQTHIEEPERSSLTVKKEIFGCTTSTDIMDCSTLQDGSPSWIQCDDPAISGTTFCQNLPPNLFDIEVLDDQNTQIQQFVGSAQGTTVAVSPGTYNVNEIKVPNTPQVLNTLFHNDSDERFCVDTLGFDHGGRIFESPNTLVYQICYEYEDEQGNDCSTLTLQSGENKVCTVKNYIADAGLD